MQKIRLILCFICTSSIVSIAHCMEQERAVISESHNSHISMHIFDNFGQMYDLEEIKFPLTIQQLKEIISKTYSLDPESIAINRCLLDQEVTLDNACCIPSLDQYIKLSPLSIFRLIRNHFANSIIVKLMECHPNPSIGYDLGVNLWKDLYGDQKQQEEPSSSTTNKSQSWYSFMIKDEEHA
jgi:hypothetical protein